MQTQDLCIRKIQKLKNAAKVVITSRTFIDTRKAKQSGLKFSAADNIHSIT